MFEPTSRYATLETAQYTRSDGSTVAYQRRRFLPAGESLPRLGEITPEPGERLDLVTARAFGDPQAFWRLGDANDVLNPLELTARPGRSLHVPLPT